MSKFKKFGDVYRPNLADKARAELDGLSHYYDHGTCRFFGTRVNNCYSVKNGGLLFTTESVQPPHGPRVHRAVIFDITGGVAFRSDDYKRGAQAEKAGNEWLASCDVVAITHEAINAAQKHIMADARRDCDRLTELFIELQNENKPE